jgi:hypothetical protein
MLKTCKQNNNLLWSLISNKFIHQLSIFYQKFQINQSLILSHHWGILN